MQILLDVKPDFTASVQVRRYSRVGVKSTLPGAAEFCQVNHDSDVRRLCHLECLLECFRLVAKESDCLRQIHLCPPITFIPSLINSLSGGLELKKATAAQLISYLPRIPSCVKHNFLNFSYRFNRTSSRLVSILIDTKIGITVLRAPAAGPEPVLLAAVHQRRPASSSSWQPEPASPVSWPAVLRRPGGLAASEQLPRRWPSSSQAYH